MLKLEEKIDRFSEYIVQSNKIVVLTGAGISTESGISDYRSKGGLWERFKPVTFQEFLTSYEKRKEYWETKWGLLESFKTAQPNAGHKAIVSLDQIGKLKGIITQNIDGLQQMAGTSNDKILELHGTNREIICLSCSDIRPWQEILERFKKGEDVPLCHLCGGLLKPNTISFGQSLDVAILQKAVEWSRDCDLFLAIGSTLVVEPAALLPRLAKQQGSKLVIITISETPLDETANLKISESIGTTMTLTLQKLH